MKPPFVSIQEGQKFIHWPKLSVFAFVVMVVSAVLAEGIWYQLTSHFSGGALVVALVLGTLLVVRVVARALTYQERELEESVSNS